MCHFVDKVLMVFAMSIGGLQYAVADYSTSGKPLPGYVCMGLKTDKEFNDWVPGSMPPKPGQPGYGGFPVFEIGTEHSKRLGFQESTAIVAWPLDEMNGFVRIIRNNGEKAWIHKDALVPFGTVIARNGHVVRLKRTCTPVVLSKDKIGYNFGGSRERE